MRKTAQNGRTAFETLLIIAFVGIVLGIAINRFMQNANAAKETLLQSELTNIRMSLKLYNAMTGKYPKSLKELIDKGYLQSYDEDALIEGKYLMNQATDESGAPVDPFGNRYYYNKDTGTVKSLTTGYNDW